MGIDFGDRRTRVIAAAGGLVAAGLAIVLWQRLPPPQLRLNDEQVFNTVDALFTALTSRDRERLSECAVRLESYYADGRLSHAVSALLTSIIDEAEQGEWEPAARRLYRFMLGQRGQPHTARG